MIMKAERLAEFNEYGYTVIGDTENDETIVAKRFESGFVMIMAVHDKYVSQIRISSEQMSKLCTI